MKRHKRGESTLSDDVTVYVGRRVRWEDSKDRPGFKIAVGTSLDLHVVDRNGAHPEIIVALSDEEVLSLTSQWLESMARERKQERERAEGKRCKNCGDLSSGQKFCAMCREMGCK
jgi:hypothetical protein